ncbi:UNVERIFIED_CONTAM: hypothetical protein RMT77_010298 [Armadillidium vulgare]|nr:Cystinosin-like protein [Armadillidium vulgare]
MGFIQSSVFIYILLLLQNSDGFLDGWWSKPHLFDEVDNSTAQLTVDDHEISVVKNDNFTLRYTLSGDLSDCVTLTLEVSKSGVVNPPGAVTICPNSSFYALEDSSLSITFVTLKEGIITLTVNATPSGIVNTQEAFTQVSVKIHEWIDTFSDVMGWMYTIAWDISFLPQIVHNWKRKSVIGLHFDFLTYNFIGFSCYGLFNIGLYWIPSMQAEYSERNPTSVLHVRLNDVIFPLYAVLCTAVQIIQCFFYERGNQRVSTTCRIISGLLLSSAVIYMILVGFIEDIWWLDFLYWLSYIKLIITCIKYVPQMYENFKLKSTEGWSIGQVSLDFVGGSLSLIQMFVLAYNYDDILSVLKDPTKLGLGLLSVFFDIIFFIQHFFLYRHNKIQMGEFKTESEKEKELNSLSTKF